VSSRKIVWITGGSSGIGLALARHYARSGCDIVLLARDPGKLQNAAAECSALGASSEQVISGEPVDVTDSENLPAVAEGLIAARGLPDLVILSAGAAANDTFLDTPPAVFDDLMNINLGGSREVARAVLPGMCERGSGQIAFVCSLAGLMGIYGYSAYSASKFAVTGLVQALRQELAGSGVDIQLVCPPEVDTPMVAAEAAHAVPQTRFLKDLVGTMQPDVVAGKIARGIERRKSVIIPGFRAGLMAWCGRHFPGLFERGSALLLRWRFR
jgi:short-subunit dehydrogenase